MRFSGRVGRRGFLLHPKFDFALPAAELWPLAVNHRNGHSLPLYGITVVYHARLLALLWTIALVAYLGFSCLLTHHMVLRSHASLALTEQLASRLQPLDATTNELQQQIDRLPDEKYQDGTLARRESNRLYGELSPILVQEGRLMKENLAATQALESPFWPTAQLAYIRNYWRRVPLLFGVWIWFAVLVPARLRQPPTRTLERTAG